MLKIAMKWKKIEEKMRITYLVIALQPTSFEKKQKLIKQFRTPF